ncbi:MAG: SpoIIE family protein phosphatase, partial [Pirellulaceae bacterium]|nr:SpoIIE family protein phosphatase [Pirellulaceae bacterium]
GLPLGMIDDADYEETQAQFNAGDRLLLFSDGAVEVHDARGELLGTQGLIRILSEADYPANELRISAVEEQILLYSNNIRLNDDLTFLEVRF